MWASKERKGLALEAWFLNLFLAPFTVTGTAHLCFFLSLAAETWSCIVLHFPIRSVWIFALRGSSKGHIQHVPREQHNFCTKGRHYWHSLALDTCKDLAWAWNSNKKHCSNTRAIPLGTWLIGKQFAGASSLLTIIKLCHHPPKLTVLPQKQSLLGSSSLGFLQSHGIPRASFQVAWYNEPVTAPPDLPLPVLLLTTGMLLHCSNHCMVPHGL